MAMIPQSRDRDILQFVYTFRVATYEQIRKKFFSKNHASVAHRRILELCKNDYLAMRFVETAYKPIKCVSLKEKAWPLIVERWPFEMDRTLFKSESPLHDIKLLEVMLRFEKLKAFDDFFSENVLQSSSALLNDPVYRDLVNIQSDGALLLKDPEGRSYLYALEFESSRKSLERYRKKLEAYYRVGSIDGVIYVCGEQGIMDCLAKVNDEVRTEKETILYMGLERSVLESSGELFFKSSLGQGIALS
jgi:hypothetical protein